MEQLTKEELIFLFKKEEKSGIIQKIKKLFKGKF